nr:NAD(P)H-dependent oxidoreductase [Xanthomonadales bacterium]
MRTLLQLNTSLYSNEGQSSQLTQRYVDAWSARNPNGAVIVRDLAADPVPHLSAERFAAFNTAPAARSGEQQLVVDYSDRLIEELRRADTVVIGLPMYNFGVPSTLKAYFDHVARANVTFKYTETGPVGLLTGKQVIVVATRGGAYAGTPMD